MLENTQNRSQTRRKNKGGEVVSPLCYLKKILIIEAASVPRVMLRVEQVITSKVAGVEESLAESKITRLGEPELVTPEGVRIKPSSSHTKTPENVMLSKSTTPPTSGSGNSGSTIPNNPKPATQKTLAHVFHGEINKKGSAVGFHENSGEMQTVKQIQDYSKIASKVTVSIIMKIDFCVHLIS